MKKIEQFFQERGISNSTKKHYLASVKLYERLHLLRIDALITEADEEEEKGIRWKNRKVKKRLIDFRNFLYANKSEGTAKQYLADIKAIYRHFEIELQPLPAFNSKQIQKTYEPVFEDLPTKQELIDSYYEANNVVKCIILFAMSSGYSKVDMLNLTVGDFIEACTDYITSDDLFKQLKELRCQNEVIPTFIGTRQKTGKKFITFCSPEAVEHISQYLIGRDAAIKEKYDFADEEDQEDLPDRLYLEDKLFGISQSQLNYILRHINAKLGLGLAGKTTRLRCHMLRKFQASTLLNYDKIKWSVQEIDSLQGRTQDKTHRAYFHNDKEKLWEKYYDSVDELMLFRSIHGIDEEAYVELEKENDFYKKEIIKNEQKMEEQRETIDKIMEMQKQLEEMVGL